MYPKTDTQKWLTPPDHQGKIDPLQLTLRQIFTDMLKIHFHTSHHSGHLHADNKWHAKLAVLFPSTKMLLLL